ncbi:hypothetical protein BGZ73_002520 [Actinomortierella ambigua]|nr:hypothetical protein BGZ73_002520 [Actinomortierella ambigua]
MDYTTLSRLKLQSLCVKYGLDASGKNEDLIQRLQAHSGQAGSDGAQTLKTTTATSTTIGASHSNNRQGELRTDVTVETVVQLEVSVKEEDHDEHHIHRGDGAQRSEATTPIKQEEEAPTTLPKDPALSPKVKQEVMHPSEMVNPFLVKAEEEEPTIKSESSEPEIKEEPELHEVAKSRKELRAFWEMRSKSDQMSSNVIRNTTRPPAKVIGKRARSNTLDESDGGDAEPRSRSPSNPLPASGTVRKLIGRFATGSSTTPEPVGSPSGVKRQRIDPNAVPTSPSVARIARLDSVASTVASSTSPTPVPSGAGSATASPKPKLSRREAAAEAARRVVRVPTGKRESARETSTSTLATTPPPPTTPRKGVSTPKRRAPSMEEHPGQETPTKKTFTGTGRGPSAETINRLATPKNKSLPTKRAAATASSTSAAVNAPAPPTPTRPRAPVLSTASRAAQRAKRGN